MPLSSHPSGSDSRPEKLDIARLQERSLIGSHHGPITGISGHLVSCPELGRRELIVPREALIPYPGQPRQFFPEADVLRLSEDLKERGQLMPMIVTPYWMGADRPLTFLIVDGGMRCRALEVAKIEEAFVVVHPYQNEAEVYRAAASTHKDDTTLGRTDRALMLARLYDLRRKETPSLQVRPFAAEIQVGYNDVHNALRIQALSPQIVAWGVQRLIVTSGLIYLANRLREYGEKVSEKTLIKILEKAIEKKNGGSLSEKDVAECFQRGLVKSGDSNEAVRLQVRRQLELWIQSVSKANREGDSLLEAAEEEDSVIVGLLGREMMSPGELEDLTETIQALSGRLAVFTRLVELAKPLGGRGTRRKRAPRRVKDKKEPDASTTSSEEEDV